MMAGGMASVSSVVVEGLGVVTPPTDMGSLVVIPIPIKSKNHSNFNVTFGEKDIILT